MSIRSMLVIFCLPVLLFVTAIAGAQDDNPEVMLDPPDSPEKVVAGPEYDVVELTCPLDGKKVSGKQVKSFISAGTDRDFCEIGAGQSLYGLWITCCDDGYCGYIEDFSNVNLKSSVREKIKKEILPNFNMKDLPPWEKYYITAKIYEWRGKSQLVIANTYLRATYTMRGLPGEPQIRKREKELRALAIEHFIKAERAGLVPLVQVPNMKYLIGELYRRNEKFKKAIGYFDDSLKIKNRPDWLEKWVLKQKALALAEYPF